MHATRYNLLTWDPVKSMVQSETQNETSFNEQKLGMKTYAYSINKYCGNVGDRLSLTHTKNVIVHGAPGTGKSFVGERGVLYALS